MRELRRRDRLRARDVRRRDGRVSSKEHVPWRRRRLQPCAPLPVRQRKLQLLHEQRDDADVLFGLRRMLERRTVPSQLCAWPYVQHRDVQLRLQLNIPIGGAALKEYHHHHVDGSAAECAPNCRVDWRRLPDRASIGRCPDDVPGVPQHVRELRLLRRSRQRRLPHELWWLPRSLVASESPVRQRRRIRTGARLERRARSRRARKGIFTGPASNNASGVPRHRLARCGMPERRLQQRRFDSSTGYVDQFRVRSLELRPVRLVQLLAA